MAAHSNHALRMASATHLFDHGDISSQQRDAIHKKARKAMGGKPKALKPPAFGSLAPMGPMPQGAGHYMGTTTPVAPDEGGGM